MNKLEVIKECIKLRYNEEAEAWSFYPYVILEESRLGALTFNVLNFDVVEMIYEVAKKRLKLFPKELHVIIDFAGGFDIDYDFVAIITCEKYSHESVSDFDKSDPMSFYTSPPKGEYFVSVFGMEYNSKTGKILNEYRMTEKKTLRTIAEDFLHALAKQND